MIAQNQQVSIDEYAEKIIRYKAKWFVGKFGFNQSDVDDFEQQIKVDLIERLPRFDPEKSSLKTFTHRIVNRKVANIIRFHTQEIRDRRCEEGSLDFEIAMAEAGKRILRTNLVNADECDMRMGRRNRTRQDEADLSNDLAHVLESLPENLRVLCERLKTESIAEIAYDMGVPRSTFYYQVIQPLRLAFESAGLRDYF